MSRRNWLIDPWAFARSSSSREGEVELREFERLAEAVVDARRPFELSANGSKGVDGRYYVRVRVEGEVGLVCQRCLEPVAHAVHHDSLFQLWPLGEPLPEEELVEDGHDALPAGSELDLAELAEDEILLGLPISPRHAGCSLPGVEEGGDSTSPFDVLNQLKRPQ